jgi:hypothetical protein
MTNMQSMTDKLARFAFYCLIMAAPACGGGGGGDVAPVPAPPPTGFEYRLPADLGDGWSITHGENQGVDERALEAMMDAILEGQFEVIDSIAIAKGGALLLDETVRTALDRNDADVGNSNLAVHISGVDAPYLGLFPYEEYDNWDERKNDITLHHVLAMQLGLQWNEWDPPYSSVDNQWNRFISSEHDFAKALLDLPVSADPGTEFAYNTAATVSLGQAVENSVPLVLDDFALNELLLPLGVTEIEIWRTPTGLPNGGGGFFLRTRDAAKFGQLLLNDGTWNGERIISSEWLAESVTPRTAIGWPDPSQWDWQITGYGYQWWTGFYDDDGVRVESIVAWGYGGQWVIVLPSLDMVIAVNSNGYDGGDAALNQAHALVAHHILPALR